MKTDLEREYLINDMLASEQHWLEEERMYEEHRNKQLPAIIKAVLPNFRKIRYETKRIKIER